MTGHGNSGPGVAVTLRLIAAWLESHPEAKVSTVNFIEHPVRVFNFGLGSHDEIAALMSRLDGAWKIPVDPSSAMFMADLEIAPGVMYTIAVSRERLETPEDRIHRELHDGTRMGPMA